MSRVKLNIDNRNTFKAFSNLNRFHGALGKSFRQPEKRVLWRIDFLRGNYYLLIVSENKPNLDFLVSEFGFVNESSGNNEAQAKCYDSFLGSLQNGQIWQFRLTANPIHSSRTESDGKRGKKYAHVTIAQQEKWLLDRADQYGVSFDRDTETPNDTDGYSRVLSFDVVERSWKTVKRRETSRAINIKTATYEGLLEIKDVEKLKKILVEGAGRSKAYGCGLLTLARIKL